MRKKHTSPGHGGRRAGAGRKKSTDPIVTYSVQITSRQAELLKRWGDDDISAGLRWLIDAAEVFVQMVHIEVNGPRSGETVQ